MDTLASFKSVLVIPAIFVSSIAALIAVGVTYAAPPDSDCKLSTSVCDEQLEFGSVDQESCVLCFDDQIAELEGDLKARPGYKLNLTPSAEIISPSQGDVFYINSVLGYVDIPLRGVANNEYRVLTDSELLWVVSDGVRNAYAWAQGSSTYARVYYPSEGCADLVAILDATVLHNIVAYDSVGITVCTQDVAS